MRIYKQHLYKDRIDVNPPLMVSEVFTGQEFRSFKIYFVFRRINSIIIKEKKNLELVK